MSQHTKPWTAEEHRRYLETLLWGISQILAATGKPLLALTLLVAILWGHPSKLIQFLIYLW